MNCVAVGDMLINESDFRKACEKCKMITSYKGFRWKEDLDRNSMRDLIRNIETNGSEAYSLPISIQESIKKAEVLFIHLCPIGKKLIKECSQLKYIFIARGGVENIDIDACKEKGISVIRCPMHNTNAVAEFTVGMIIAETRNITRAHVSLKQGIWREEYPNSGHILELRSMTVGIIGFGTIGKMVAKLLKAFSCNILIYDPYVKNEDIEKEGYILTNKQHLLKNSDVITLHGRIGPNDPPIIGAEELTLMKNTSYLINTARAVLIDINALEHALRTHQIQGAALDVYPEEPSGPSASLLELDAITFTNHRGGDTLDSYIRSPELLVNMFEEVIKTGRTATML